MCDRGSRARTNEGWNIINPMKNEKLDVFDKSLSYTFYTIVVVATCSIERIYQSQSLNKKGSLFILAYHTIPYEFKVRI